MIKKIGKIGLGALLFYVCAMFAYMAFIFIDSTFGEFIRGNF